MITLLTIGFGDYCPTSDYIRYKEQHRQDRDVSNDHEHNQIGQIYFDFYRVTVYIWTLLGLSWLGGLISLIVDSASKVSLKKRVDMDDYNAGRFCIHCREIECDTHYGHPNLYTHT
ncbi:unnamed protein product [Oikopleura dioica]|uniref:Uncharacterized protein n=1 Tax=Oikopleura dioica TaxID=34765 RepID=E4X0M9_OIKDI|nr:unnamed protein product [Oikopleura dioica]